MQATPATAISSHLAVRPEWLARRQEPALEPDLPIVDPHHHLIDRPESGTYLLPDLLKDISEGGHNVVADSSCGLGGTGDAVVAGALGLGALGDNGGLTPTMLPAATSPLAGQVPADACVDEDQRALARPIGPACEVGAVEIDETQLPPEPPEPPAPTTPSVPTAPPAPPTPVPAVPRFTG